MGRTYRVGGMAKGSGMIHVNMATMLAFITTDAALDPVDLKASLGRATDLSFNLVTIDGDTSTNDMLVVLANGARVVAAAPRCGPGGVRSRFERDLHRPIAADRP